MAERTNRNWPLRILTLILVLGIIGFGIVVAIQRRVVHDAGPVVTTAQGSFYKAPKHLPSGQPGAIIRSRPHAVPASTGAPKGTTARAILYTSRDFRTGKPIAVSGVVYLPPPGRVPAGGRPIIAWAHGTSGIASPCAPSLESAPSQPGFSRFLQQGWVVVTTDYRGLGTEGPHQYLIGPQAGHEVLDSVRAARRLPGSNASDRVIIWGHSQGGQSVLFAGNQASSYAPELQVLGLAAAAPAVKLRQLLELDAGRLTGQLFVSLVLWSWSHSQPGAKLTGIVPEPGMKLVNSIAGRCFSAANLTEDLPAAKEEQLFGTINIDQLSRDPVWSKLVAESTPSLPGVGPPMLIAQGTEDRVVAPQSTAEVAASLCKHGRRVESVVMNGVDHADAGESAAPRVFSWAKGLFDRQAPPSNCPS